MTEEENKPAEEVKEEVTDTPQETTEPATEGEGTQALPPEEEKQPE